VNGASSRVRHYAYLPELSARGFEVTSHHLIDDEVLADFYAGRSRRRLRIAGAYAARAALLRGIDRFDLVWIEKEVLPGLPFAAERAVFANPNVATVVDFDDLWIERHRRGPFGDFFAQQEARKLRHTFKAATTVTASNRHLADALARMTGRRPTVIENAIDTSTYRKTGAAADARRAASPRKPRIGWIGTPYTANLYLPEVAAVLNKLAREGLTETVLIGADGSAPEIAAKRIGWSLDGEIDAVADIDIGIQPLVGDAFDRCKSGWKLYQYMASGRPVVASGFGFAADLIEDGVTGFLVQSPEDFERRLRMLATDGELLQKMGRNAQAAIAARYGLEAGADATARVFAEAIASVRQRRAPGG
jgi:glycosyltransferase involved in cell wall biosynthesis